MFLSSLKIKKKRSLLLELSWVIQWTGVLICLFSGCTTTEIQPEAMPSPPAYTQVPHPPGNDLADLQFLLNDSAAPKDPGFTKSCDQQVKKLFKATQSRVEIISGIEELVKRDPVHYHWCFYTKLFTLENEVKAEAYLEEKQKNVIEVFEFLTPVARAFAKNFQDSRYLRWTVSRYQSLSARVFYRKLDLTPSGTLEMVQPANPFGLWRNAPTKDSVLEKYRIDPSQNESQPSVTPSPGDVQSIKNPEQLPKIQKVPNPEPSIILSPSPTPSR